MVAKFFQSTIFKRLTTNARQNVSEFVILLIIIILLNIIGNALFYRFDLTSEKRYTLTDKTKDIIRNLDDIVYIKVYLDGDLPAQYKRLRNEVRTILNEFRSYNKKYIQFEFVDIISGKDRRAIHQITQELAQKGIQPIIDYEGSGTEMSQRFIIPGAVATYKERQVGIQLLVSSTGPTSASKEVIVNNSIQALEFLFADAIRKLTKTRKEKIAFIEGHGELKPVEVASITEKLSEYYVVERVKIDGKLNALKGYSCIIIAKPTQYFSEKDKYIIDQFIMHGGTALFLVDQVAVEMDSLQNNNQTIGLAKNLNLDDLLFKWGVRINYDLLLDVNGAQIPIITGLIGNQPQYKFYSWYYFPVIFGSNVHPIVKNIEPIKFEFVSSIDTIAIENVKKTILLHTSRYTQRKNTPVTINLNEVLKPPQQMLFNRKHLPVAVLLEGQFESVFYRRIPPEISENPEMKYRSNSLPTKIIVISDGDVIKNQFLLRNDQYLIYPLGFDRYTNITYGNETFIMNCISYLVDKVNLLEIRAREIRLYLLDKTRLQNEQFVWQFLNIFIPIIFVLIIGIVFFFIRKHTYTKIAS